MKDAHFAGTTAVALLFGLGVMASGSPANAQDITSEICDQNEDGFIDSQEAMACGRSRLEQSGRDDPEGAVGRVFTQEDFIGEMEDADDPEGLFAEVDADGDGVITQEEWEAWDEERFRAATEGTEGQMSVEEYERYYRGEDMSAVATGATTAAAAGTADMPDGTDFEPLVEELQEQGQFSQFVEVVQSAGLASELQGQGPFTVFAPTDAAFEQLGGSLDQLQGDQVATLLKHHIVSGAHPADALPDQLSPLAGDAYGVDVVDTGAVLVPNNGQQVPIQAADMRADSGYIHAIDSVLVPQDLQSALQQQTQ